MNDVNFEPSTNNNTSIVPSNNFITEKEEVKESEQEYEEGEEDDVNDPFGSYQAPTELVVKNRTISQSGPGPEDTDDTDDSLPNLETVKTKEPVQQLDSKMGSLGLQESQKKNGLKPEFDLDNGGRFIEDSYLPPTQTSGVSEMKTVEFKYKSSSSVKIAGDFNAWQPQDMEKGGDEEWKFLIDLPAGEYDY